MTLALRLAADAVALFHLAFVLFVVFGGLLVWRWPRRVWLHLPAVGWGALDRVHRLDLPAHPAGKPPAAARRARPVTPGASSIIISGRCSTRRD